MVRRNLNLVYIIFFLFCNSLTFAQSVSGKVTDISNNPIVGALVVVEGTDYASYTNASGKFILSAMEPGAYQLLISSDRYQETVVSFDINEEDLNLATIIMQGSINIAQDDESDIAIISIGDLSAGQEQDMIFSSILSSGNDVFEQAASYNFWSARFRIRGYDNERTQLYINGMSMNDLDDGRIYWNAWGGLNDVMRNRDSELGLGSSGIGFGNIGGISEINVRASTQRPGSRLRYSLGNRSYVHRLAFTHNSGERKSGWSYSVSGARRWGNEGYIEGTFYDSWSYFGNVEKVLNDEHKIGLTIMGTPLQRGRSGGSIQEMYDLTDNVYYNPYWGYQNGEKRNARIYKSHLPIGILNHDWNISESTTIRTSIGYQSGKYGTTGLDWYLAPDPRPDYYRKLPSFQESEEAAALVTQFYQENPEATQIQWDQLYNINYNKYAEIENVNGIEGNTVAGRLSSYIIEEQRFDNNKLSFNTIVESVISPSLIVHGGFQFLNEKTENFKVLDDLMGGEFFVDYDEFAIRDFPGNNEVIQNDLNNINRVLYEGDVFGWNYDINTSRIGSWGQLRYEGSKMDYHFSGEISRTGFYREGYYKNGRFPNNSFGKSDTKSFNNFGVKGGATYKIDGRNYLYANGTYRTSAPYSRFAYLSARTRDEVVSGLKSETIFGGEAGYLLRFPALKGRLSAYYTEFKDQVESASFYHDEERTFVNYVMNGIDKRHMGIELGIEGNITSTLSVELAGAIGEFIYTSRPEASISQDNNAEKIDDGRVVYIKNFYVPGTPQTAGTIGLNYRSPRFWFVNLNLNYFDRAYLDFNPDRRTIYGVDLVNKTENPELWSQIIDQERLDAQYTVDLFAGKSWRFNDYYLSANISINNILNNQKFITGGFEQYRYDYEGKDINRFPPRYFYSYGTNFSVNVSFSF